MINSKSDLKRYLKSDKAAREMYTSSLFKARLIGDFDIYIFKYLRCLRMQEYYLNCRSNVFDIIRYYYYGNKKHRIGRKLMFDIPTNVFDEGLVLSHHGTLIVNAGAKVGKNCVLHGNNCIGNNGVDQEAPVIGDNVDIGVGAVIIGNIRIANGIRIGANAVVTKSFLEENVTIAGNPAKVINRNNQEK